jgi:hypothetical protein
MSLFSDSIPSLRVSNSDVSDQHIPFELYVHLGGGLLAFFCQELILDIIRDACHFGHFFIVHL